MGLDIPCLLTKKEMCSQPEMENKDSLVKVRIEKSCFQKRFSLLLKNLHLSLVAITIPFFSQLKVMFILLDQMKMDS